MLGNNEMPVSYTHLDVYKRQVATLLVQQGTLNVQDPIVVGNTFGRVRAMTNDLGRRVKVAGPSTPVSITGLNEAPMAGDHFAVYEDEKSARAAGEELSLIHIFPESHASIYGYILRGWLCCRILVTKMVCFGKTRAKG